MVNRYRGALGLCQGMTGTSISLKSISGRCDRSPTILVPLLLFLYLFFYLFLQNWQAGLMYFA